MLIYEAEVPEGQHSATKKLYPAGYRFSGLGAHSAANARPNRNVAPSQSASGGAGAGTTAGE